MNIVHVTAIIAVLLGVVLPIVLEVRKWRADKAYDKLLRIEGIKRGLAEDRKLKPHRVIDNRGFALVEVAIVTLITISALFCIVALMSLKFRKGDWEATPRPTLEESRALWGETPTEIRIETEYDLKDLVRKVEAGTASEEEQIALSTFIEDDPELWNQWCEEDRLGEWD